MPQPKQTPRRPVTPTPTPRDPEMPTDPIHPHPTAPSAADQRLMAGPPEGTEHGSTGDLGEHPGTPLAPPAPADSYADTTPGQMGPEGHPEPGVTTTTPAPMGEPRTPATGGAGGSWGLTLDDADDVPGIVAYARLVQYLATYHPGDLGRVLPTGAVEEPCDTAVRLLMVLTTSATPTALARCPEQYCNRPAGHLPPCGWVHG